MLANASKDHGDGPATPGITIVVVSAIVVILEAEIAPVQFFSTARMPDAQRDSAGVRKVIDDPG